MGDNQIIQVGCVLLPVTGGGVIHLGKSTLSDVRTMSCIPTVLLARHRLCPGIVDVYLVN